MAETVLSVTQYDNPDILLVGEISRPGEDGPAVKGPIVVKPTQSIRVALPEGSYVYEFDASVTGRFTLVASTRAPPDQTMPFDTGAGGQIGQVFPFEVRR